MDKVNILFAPLPFAFITLYSLDECIERLKKCDNSHAWIYVQKTVVEITLVKNNMAEFHLSQKGSRTDKVEANGYLEQVEENSTHISGKVFTDNNAPGFILMATLILVIVTLIPNFLGSKGNPNFLDVLRFLVSFWFVGSLIIYGLTLIENYHRRKAIISLLQKNLKLKRYRVNLP